MTVSQLRRARSTESKEARRSVIVRAARALFDANDYAAITMADVAKRSRLAKGTVFLYFATKEALFLDLLDELLDDWLGALHEAAAQDDRPWPSAQLAATIVASLDERPALRRLLPLGPSVLERNVPDQRLADFKHKLLRRFFGIGALIEQRLGLSRPGDGTQLLVFAHAMIVGLGGRTDSELHTALTVLFNGFHRKS